MNREDILEIVTTEDVVHIMSELGGGEPVPDNKGNLYFRTICHDGDKHKLQYFIHSKMFCCYTSCGSMSLFDVIMSAKNCEFVEAVNLILRHKGIKNSFSKGKGLKRSDTIKEEMDFLNKHLYKPKKLIPSLPTYDQNVLSIFDDYIPNIWVQEGIEETVAQLYSIKFYFNQYKAIIPHRDINGDLIGIRGRAFFQRDIEQGKKYMPVTIQGLTYRFPVEFNLYGIYENQNNIRRYRKAIVFEGEKSVLKYASYFGQENNIALATMGMNMSLYQRDLLLNLGVDEVIIAYDKQYQPEYLDDINSKEYKEFEKYKRTLIKITKMLINYVNVSIILCWDDVLGYKDAPIDNGKDVFEKLYKERYLIGDISELEEMV
ncbi:MULTISPECIES: hypothetical protein [unclassified Clostridium]|uniref:hypothetical protein n=1 Tax=unclassified Clostridium TaxID=2614128 RepID=UPI0025C0A29C|nr:MULTISPECIES: hypothetical protein [unclassified Clostridium]